MYKNQFHSVKGKEVNIIEQSLSTRYLSLKGLGELLLTILMTTDKTEFQGGSAIPRQRAIKHFIFHSDLALSDT